MNGWSIPPLLMASINASVALHHGVIYLRTRRSREPLTFAVMAAALAVYDVACTFLYSAPDSAVARPWQLVQAWSLTVGAVALLLFVSDYAWRPYSRFTAWVCAGYGLLSAAALVGGSTTLYTHVPLVRQIGLPFGLSVHYHEVVPGPLALGLYAMSFAVFFHALRTGLRLHREGERGRALRLLAVTGVLFAACLNDLVLGMGLVRSIYLVEYAFMGMVVLMADALSSELVRAGIIEEALRSSERAYREVFNAAGDAIFVHDARTGALLDVNSTMEDLYGYGRDEALRLTVADLSSGAAPFTPEAAREKIRLAAEEGPQVFDWKGRRKDGTEFWVEVALRSTTIGGENRVLAVVRDVTERKKAARKLQRQMDRLRALRTIDGCITGGESLSEIVEVILGEVLRQLEVDAARVLFLDPASGTFAVGGARGFRSGRPMESGIPLDGSPAGWAVAEGGAIHALFGDRPEELLPPGAGGEEFRGYHAVPLSAKGHLLGVLELFERTERTRGPGWYEFLETIGGQLAIAIDSRRLLENLERSNAELAAAYDSTLAGWSRALELRDRETNGHSERVVDLSVRLAREMGVPPALLVHVRRGALLHDIGKMGIPDQVLLKPGPLTEEEWAVMRRHPGFAFELLKPIQFLAPALDIPYAHHERWDGSGYPRGLSGEAIPLAARVFAVADAWDALQYERPYREVWPEERVKEYLRQEAGRRFDPAVVSAFLRMVARPEEPARS